MIMELVFKFCKARDLVLNTCAGTSLTPKACLLVSEHLHSAGCEKNSASFHDALSLRMEVYANQVLSADSDLTGSREAVEMSRMFVKEIAVPLSKRTADSQNVPSGLVPVHTFPVYITHILRNVCNDVTLFENCGHIPIFQWSDKWTAAYTAWM